jgi:AcrR family transcriptional regulator
VVAAAGVSRRTFYELFEGRQACFLAAFEQAIEHMATKAGAAFRAERSWVDRVRAGLLEVLVFMEAEPELARVCVVEALAAGPGVLERRREVLVRLAGVVDEGRLRARSEPPALTAEGVVGAVLSVIHARLSTPLAAGEGGALPAMLGALMGIIVLPYLGPAAARRELGRPLPESLPATGAQSVSRNPLENLQMRVTYRTLRVLGVIAESPGASNRHIAERAGIADQGQISKLLSRLEGLGLIENTGEGHARGATNCWRLTARGLGMQGTIAPHHRAPRRTKR